MKISLIVGHYYTDGKFGVRELLSFDDDNMVTYKLHSAKKTRDFVYQSTVSTSPSEINWESTIGSTSKCLAVSFKTWAKKGMTPEEGRVLILQINAQRTKWTPTELKFFTKECSRNAQAGQTFPADTFNARVLTSLENKQAVVYDRKNGTVALTEFGAIALKGLRS